MNRTCPTCGDDLLERGDPYLREWRDGWLEAVQDPPDLVPYDESMRPENRGPDGPFTIGGAWFCSADCRDAYKETEADGE